MIYRNLEDIIKSDVCGRVYFNTLPTDVQRELAAVGEYIHTTGELHSHARFAESERRHAILAQRK